MEKRTLICCLLVSFFSVLLNLVMKVQYFRVSWVYWFVAAGVCLNLNLAYQSRKEAVRQNFALFDEADRDRAMLSPVRTRYLLVSALVMGSYVGYNLSICYEAVGVFPWRLGISYAVHTVTSSLCGVGFFLLENVTPLQARLPFIYKEEQKWTMGSFLVSLFCCMGTAEGVALTGTLYLAFFELIYYGIYYAFMYFGWMYFLGGCLLYAIVNFLTGNLRRYLRRRPYQEAVINKV